MSPIKNQMRWLSLAFVVATTVAATKPVPTPKTKKPIKVAKAAPEPKRETYDDIVKSYMFVADFERKEPKRNVSDELFWTYPWEIPVVDFPIYTDITDVKRELPATQGSGRAVEHLNYGRALFLDEKFEDARTAWLAGRAKYGKDYPFHRRNDYFIGNGFMAAASSALKGASEGFENVLVKSHFNNTATFFSWAFIVKKDVPDPLVEEVTPKGLYNLAAIYFKYGRWMGAYGAAEEGMNFLRRTGRKEFRTEFHRVMAESYLYNRSYLEALQAFDSALRQDRDKPQAAAIFSRAGDMYFQFNNYELAEDAYRLSGIIDEEQRHVSPAQMALRGESLFWLGKFADSQRMFHFALNGIPFRKDSQQLTVKMASWAKLRFADAWMAQKKFSEATLAYFQVEHDYRGTPAARIAGIRRACLELPFYLGRNVDHARGLLEGFKNPPKETDSAASKKDEVAAGKQDPKSPDAPKTKEEYENQDPILDMPDEATELAWTCYTSSYSERERTKDMVERVRAFADRYPESRFLRSMAEPVRAVQASILDEHFKKGETYRALSFFEANRKALFPKVSDDLAQLLYATYAKVFQPKKASEFWPQFDKVKESDLKLIQQAVVAAEMTDQLNSVDSVTSVAGSKTKNAKVKKNSGKLVSVWKNRSDAMVRKLEGRPWTIAPGPEVLDYIARLRATTEGQAQHLPWIFELSLIWGQTNAALACELEYPLLVQIAGRSPTSYPPDVFAKHITSLVQRTLPGSLDTDESCAASMLDLEASLMKDSPTKIAATYLARREWPMKQAFVNQLWLASEKLYETGDKANAKELWQTIDSKAPREMPEVTFAKSRLDPKRTEFENLWN